MARPSTHVTVIGVGADGLAGVPADVVSRVLAAPVVIGGERHLAMLPSSYSGERVPLPSPLRKALPALVSEHSGAVVLASGDPLVSGIGSTLIELLGASSVTVLPHVSSLALARARMGWPAESVTEVSVVGRDPRLVLPHLSEGRRLLVLTSGADTPAALGSLLTSLGHGDSEMTVLGDLAGPSESRFSASASALGSAGSSVEPVPALHVLAIEVRGQGVHSLATGLPDEAFETDGQITRRDLRVSALARLAPQPGQLLWDVGAGSGSVGIEWALTHPTCRTIAIDPREDRAARVSRNAAALGVPTAVSVVVGSAPSALADLPRPDAIFVGGGGTAPGVLDACVSALAPGGRLVVHGVTLETEAVLVERFATHGGELTRLQVESAAPLGTFTGWQPTRAVTQWAWVS